MAKLTFNRAELCTLLEYAQRMKAETIVLVSDHGVYFINPSEPPPRHCVFARGCNPNTNDNWYSKKVRTFGPDDGAEHFTAAQIQHWLALYNTTGIVTLKITSKKIVLTGPPST